MNMSNHVREILFNTNTKHTNIEGVFNRKDYFLYIFDTETDHTISVALMPSFIGEHFELSIDVLNDNNFFKFSQMNKMFILSEKVQDIFYGEHMVILPDGERYHFQLKKEE